MRRFRFHSIVSELQQREDIASPGHGAAWESPRQDLRQAGHVRQDAEEGLGAARGHPEARNHLVEDEEGAGLLRQVPDLGQEGGVQGHGAVGGPCGLDDDGSDIVLRLQGAAQRLRIVLGHEHLGLEDGRRDAHRLRRGPGGEGEADNAVVPAVEVAVETHQPLPAGEGAGETHGHHCRLGAGAGEAHHLRRRHQALHPLRPAYLHLMAGAVVGALLELLRGRPRDLRVRVAEEEGAVAHYVVDNLVAVHVPLA